MKIIINLGRGDLQNGCHDVSVQLLDSQHRCLQQLSGNLPAAPRLAKLHHQWQSGYLAFYQEKAMRIGLLESEGIRYSEADFFHICQQIEQEFNHWLTNSSFAAIEKTLRSNLDRERSICIIVTAENLLLQQLPWHLWHFILDYHQAEIAFSPINWQQTKPPISTHSKVRILVVLGNDAGINLQQDLESLKILADAELVVLVEPRLIELNEYLWQPEGWDILLFSGHSCTEIETGYIYLNATENIAIAQLQNSLSKAIALGLKIAIFNSCEGMGLAKAIADLSLPYGVVMSESVPDKIAQVFLKYFLMAFAAGKTLTLAVKEARFKLAGWEGEYICASWLPVIWQNPLTSPLTWSDLQFVPPSNRSLKSWKTSLITSLAVSGLIVLGRSLSLLEPIELWAYDRLMQQRPAETIDPRILVVEVTDEDSDRYPLDDKSLVEAIDMLEQHQPAAIGIDIHRASARGSDYANLIEAIETSPRLFPVCAYSNDNDSYAPPQGLSPAKLQHQMGFSDLLIDNNGDKLKHDRLTLSGSDLKIDSNSKVRRHLLSYDPSLATNNSRCLTPYSLSFQLAYEYLDRVETQPLTVNQQQQWQSGNIIFQEMSRKFGGYQHLDGNSSQIALNYRSGQPGTKISLTQLRSGTIQPQLITDRIVLIGYTASIARDYFDTPYGNMPGVWIHAHQTSQIISAVQDGRSLIWALPQWGDWLWVLGWSISMVVILMMLRQQPAAYSILALVIAIVALEQFCLLILIRGGWLPLIPTLLSLLIVSGVVMSDRQKHQSLTKSP